MNREGGTTIKMLERPTADSLLKMPFVVPPPDCCVTVFRALRNKLTPPFRLTVKGKIVDLMWGGVCFVVLLGRKKVDLYSALGGGLGEGLGALLGGLGGGLGALLGKICGPVGAVWGSFKLSYKDT